MRALWRGTGARPVLASGADARLVHQQMAAALDWALDEIASIKASDHRPGRPAWPMIVLRTPKRWTGPKVVDGQAVEGTFRSHQGPVTDFASKPDHLKILEDWVRTYKPNELFAPSSTA